MLLLRSVRAQEVVRLRQLSVYERQLIDWRRHPETGHVCRQELLVKRVRGYLSLELPVMLVMMTVAAATNHHPQPGFLHF